MKKEYRVVWKRKKCEVEDGNGGLVEFDPPRKTKRFLVLKSAKKFIFLLGPEPWDYFGKQPEDYVCCNGNCCACCGKTYKEQAQEYIEKGMPEIEYIRLEEREVGEYIVCS